MTSHSDDEDLSGVSISCILSLSLLPFVIGVQLNGENDDLQLDE